jgi:hypothetical protein
MIRSILIFCSLFVFLPLAAQQRVMAGPGAPTEVAALPITSLNDEFNGAASLERWRSHGAVEGWPEMIRTLRIDDGGVLRLEPTVSG